MHGNSQSSQIFHRKVAHLRRLRREVSQLKSKASEVLAQEQQERIMATSVLLQQKPNTHNIKDNIARKIRTGASLSACCLNTLTYTCAAVYKSVRLIFLIFRLNFSNYTDCSQNRANSAWRWMRKFEKEGGATRCCRKTLENSENNDGGVPTIPADDDGPRTFTAAAGAHLRGTQSCVYSLVLSRPSTYALSRKKRN